MSKTIKLNIVVSMAVMTVMALASLTPALAGAEQKNNTKDREQKVTTKVTERLEKAEEQVKEKRLNKETQTVEKRQKTCEKSLSKIERRMDKLSTQSTKLLGVMLSFQDKVEGFYEKGQLTVSNYDDLLTNVNLAQEAARTEIATLAELNIDIDCSDPEVAVRVSSFKGSTNSAKEALRDYRKSLVALISSMRSSSAVDKTDDGSGSNIQIDRAEESSSSPTSNNDVTETKVEETN